MQTEIVKIKGMTCMGCVGSVKNVLEKTPGVGSAAVSLERSEAAIQYDPAVITISQLMDAIQGAGFEVVD